MNSLRKDNVRRYATARRCQNCKSSLYIAKYGLACTRVHVGKVIKKEIIQANQIGWPNLLVFYQASCTMENWYYVHVQDSTAVDLAAGRAPL